MPGLVSDLRQMGKPSWYM